MDLAECWRLQNVLLVTNVMPASFFLGLVVEIMGSSCRPSIFGVWYAACACVSELFLSCLQKTRLAMEGKKKVALVGSGNW